MISENLETFWGQPVKDWPLEGTAAHDAGSLAYRIRIDWDQYEKGASVDKILTSFANAPGAAEAGALVIGAWDFESSTDAGPLIRALAEAAPKFPKLEAIFLGDIIGEEQEISWIQQSDITPLLVAYPKLRCLRVRGGEGLKLEKVKHEYLEQLAFESGGLPRSVIQGALACELPELRHLEFWLGDESYGYQPGVDVLKPLVDGELFPSLVYLGLRNSQEQDNIAKLVAGSKILQRIGALDLSMGNLTDEGARALLEGGNLTNLESLDVHHHYLSEEMVSQLKAACPSVAAHDVQEADEYNGEIYRMIAVSE